MRIEVAPGGRVRCQVVLDLPLSAAAAWGEVRDFGRYACHDYFHAEFRFAGGRIAPGARYVVVHRFMGFTVERVGRVLWWRELDAAGEHSAGYGFSDLSRRGPRRGFPHVFGYRLHSAGANQCRLEILVRGRWTARLVPRWAARVWLWWVFSHIVLSVRNSLLLVALRAPVARCRRP